MDEEPPHALDEEAVDIGLTAALMVGATPVDEIHVMRKIVIDGSTTTGFQRTCIIAVGGEIVVDGEKIQLQALCLEEDAARKTGETALTTRYRLDRLCIPLIEISTAPVIFTPQAAERAALALGRLLRATKRVKRGLGTIRQDLNISIRGGAITEIKGVQELDLVSQYVAYEVQRQLALLMIRDELAARGVGPDSLSTTFVDVTKIFATTQCPLIAKAVKHGVRVMAVALPKFRGLLGRELISNLRLGTELSDYAKFWGRVGGIFHTDELPAYGISVAELNALTETLDVGAEDAIVFVAAEPENARDALTAVVERAKQAMEGVPQETRGAAPDGVTHYSRPRPGAARMYPETDVPPLPVTREYLARVRANLPESPDDKLSRLMRVYGLNDQLASQLSDSPYDEVFERIATETEVATSFLAATLTETLKSLRREGVDVEHLSDGLLVALFKDMDDEVLAKEAIPDVLRWLGTHKDTGIRDALDALGLRMVPSSDVEQVVEQIVAENAALVRQRGRSAFGPLMGIIMKKYRGRIDAKKASHILREKLSGKGV
jgi:glutamyl-tRNA(Gln) amidotransferase subunit E